MIAITGASGHLGQWVVANLLAAGREILCVSRRPSEHPAIDGLHWAGEVRILACDLSDPGSPQILEPALRGAETVVHLAAHVPADTARNSDEDAIATLRQDVLGTIHLLQALRGAAGLRCVVYASRFEVYGPPSSLPVTEDHPTNPVSYNGAAKLAGEKHVALFGRGAGVPCCALRMPAIYGPGDRIRRAIGNFVRAAARGEDLPIYGDGADLRDLVYAADAAEAVAAAIERNASGVFNLGTGTGFSIAEMAETACRVGGGCSRVVRRDRVKPRLDYILAIDRARESLGWSPRTTLEEGIRAQMEWVRRPGPDP